jgi:FkbM family methyltransferase
LTYIWAVETVRVETPYGTFACLKGDFITANLRKFGAHQRSDLAAALGLIEQGDTVIDIGSHIGTFAIPFGRAVGSSGTVVAFEAMKDHLVLLEQNIHDNGLDGVVKAVWAAVTMGDTPLRVEFIQGNSGATRLGGSAGRLSTILFFLTRLSKVRLLKSKTKLRRRPATFAGGGIAR